MQSSHKSLHEAGETLEQLLRALNDTFHNDDESYNNQINDNRRTKSEARQDDVNSRKSGGNVNSSSPAEKQVSSTRALDSRGSHNADLNDRGPNKPQNSQGFNNRGLSGEGSGRGLKRAGSMISRNSSSTPNLVAGSPADLSKPAAPQQSLSSWVCQRCSELDKELRQVSTKLRDSQQQNQELLRQLDESSKIRHGLEKREQGLRQIIHGLGVSESELQEMLAEAQSSTRKRTVSQTSSKFSANDGVSNENKLAEENRNLTKELQRLESHQEKTVNDYGIFLQSIAASSSTPTLDKSVDLKSAEILGMGNYGFVMVCNSAQQNQRLVVKLQSQRWVDVAAHEWSHGSVLGKHAHIVAYVTATMHRDTKREVCHLLEKGFQDGALTGKKPKFFPDIYFCLALEYMNRGTVQNFMDKGLLTMEGTAAVTRQVASALAFIHHNKQTHNDIKPENILLADIPGSDHLVVKLADLGLADHSMERKRDCDLYAYTVWCLCLGHKFGKCPEADGREAAVTQLQKRVGRVWSVLATVVSGLWQDEMEPAEIKDHPKLQDCEVRAPQSQGLHEELESAAKHDAHMRTLHLSGKVSVMVKGLRRRMSHEAEEVEHRL